MKIREAKKAQTREALLDAAARVFARRGYQDASLEEIAAEAGYSTGAVYSSFAGKDDLLLTLADREVARETEGFAAAVSAGDTIAERLRRGAEYWMGFLERDPDLYLLIMQFWSRAVRDPEVRERFGARRAELTDTLERLIESSVRELGGELAIPARQGAVVFLALAEGIAIRKLAEPHEVPDDLFAQAATLLGLAAFARRDTSS